MTATLTPAARGGVIAARASRRRLGLVVALAVLLIACVLSVTFGSRVVAWSDVVAGVLHPEPGNLAQAAVHARVPRTLLGLLVGAALGLSGALLQGATRNPLADPGILGLTQGASLAVVIALAWFGVGALRAHVLVALIGAGIAAAVVYGVGSLGREGPTPLKVTLAGAATAAAASSLTSMVLLTHTDVLDVFRFWQVGSLGRADAATITQVLPFLVLGTLMALASSRGLDTLALGDDAAVGLGRHPGRVRLLAAGSAVLLAGAATAATGPIGFVGLTMPHLARSFTGPDHRWVLPYSAVLGAGLLVAADVLGRVVARPQDLEVGVVAALLGAPVLIAIVRRTKVREL